MGARSVEELVVWRLADELRRGVYALLATGTAAQDWRFCDQARTAAASITADIAEGFGRDSHSDFARFLVVARGSLYELQEHLRDGCARGHWSAEQVEGLHTLCRRCSAGVTSLIKYLRSSATPRHRISTKR
jgi:four helix bundle protein